MTEPATSNTDRADDSPGSGADVEVSDNLPFMQRLADCCCDLIYIDPPFNSQRRLRSPSRPAADFDDRHEGRLAGYLDFMRPRLAEMRRLLSSRGTLYVHVDWRAVHHLRIELDALFGEDHFLNEIIWSYRSGGRPGRWFFRKHDNILVYARHPGRHTFNVIREGAYRTRDMQHDEQGRPYKSTKKGRIYFHPEGPALGDVWDMPILSTVSLERTAYPTQKPLALLERIITASSNPGDVVADFFCGSGTTLVAAQRLGRRGLGCDISDEAVRVTRDRLRRTTLPAPALVFDTGAAP